VGNGRASVVVLVHPTCPMCRAPWKNDPVLVKYIDIPEKLDALAVQRYLDWLYSGRLTISSAVRRLTDAFNVALLKCWAVASAVGDKVFKRDVITMFFDEAEAQFWTESVSWAFDEEKDESNEEIRAFVVEVFMVFMQPGWFKREGEKKEGAKWPEAFVWAVADKALEGVKMKSFGDVERVWRRKGCVEGVEEKGDDEEVLFGESAGGMSDASQGSARKRVKYTPKSSTRGVRDAPRLKDALSVDATRSARQPEYRIAPKFFQ
jgi:hypothetical protein